MEGHKSSQDNDIPTMVEQTQYVSGEEEPTQIEDEQKQPENKDQKQKSVSSARSNKCQTPPRVSSSVSKVRYFYVNYISVLH